MKSLFYLFLGAQAFPVLDSALALLSARRPENTISYNTAEAISALSRNASDILSDNLRTRTYVNETLFQEGLAGIEQLKKNLRAAAQRTYLGATLQTLSDEIRNNLKNILTRPAEIGQLARIIPVSNDR